MLHITSHHRCMCLHESPHDRITSGANTGANIDTRTVQGYARIEQGSNRASPHCARVSKDSKDVFTY
jgi:hypothetical protein